MCCQDYVVLRSSDSAFYVYFCRRHHYKLNTELLRLKAGEKHSLIVLSELDMSRVFRFVTTEAPKKKYSGWPGCIYCGRAHTDFSKACKMCLALIARALLLDRDFLWRFINENA